MTNTSASYVNQCSQFCKHCYKSTKLIMWQFVIKIHFKACQLKKKKKHDDFTWK